MDISLLYIDPDTRLASLRLEPKTVTGLTKLTQVVILSLLNVSGRDVLDPDLGGGLPELVGMNISPDDTTEVFAEVALRVKKTQSEIISSQIGLALGPEEKLKEIQIISIDQGQNIDEVLVRLRIVNEKGRSAEVVI